jgi:hypothetical protein
MSTNPLFFLLEQAMAIFFETTKQVLQVNAAVLALFFGPGLTPTSQCSSGPPSNCDAPFYYYKQVALLHFLLLFSVLSSCFLASHAYLAVAVEKGESLQGLGVAAKFRARMALLCAIIFSTVAVGLAVSVYHYILEIRYTVFTCMPASIRFIVFWADAVVVVAGTSMYARFLKAAIFEV